MATLFGLLALVYVVLLVTLALPTFRERRCVLVREGEYPSGAVDPSPSAEMPEGPWDAVRAIVGTAIHGSPSIHGSP